MRKVFKMEDLECANCAAKMQDAIAKIDGVNSVNISFMTQKLVLEADDARFDEILEQAAQVCSKVDKSCTIIR